MKTRLYLTGEDLNRAVQEYVFKHLCPKSEARIQVQLEVHRIGDKFTATVVIE